MQEVFEIKQSFFYSLWLVVIHGVAVWAVGYADLETAVRIFMFLLIFVSACLCLLPTDKVTALAYDEQKKIWQVLFAGIWSDVIVLEGSYVSRFVTYLRLKPMAGKTHRIVVLRDSFITNKSKQHSRLIALLRAYPRS